MQLTHSCAALHITNVFQVVFSRGYGLEDDEKAAGDQSFKFTVGDYGVIQALNDAIPGMQGKNSIRILQGE